MDMGVLALAESKLRELQGSLARLEGGGAPGRKELLASLLKLRSDVASSTQGAVALGAERDALAEQVKTAQAKNDKLRYQLAHLQKSAAQGGVVAAPATAQAAASSTSAAAAAAKQAQQARVAKMQQGAGASAGDVTVEGPGGARYPPTHKLYFDEMQRLECEGVLLAVGSVEEKGTEKTVVILDQTVMHPQGGGQPTDTGTICCGGATFTVDMVRAVGGNLDSLIYHFGTFTTGDAAAFAVGAGASVSVDGPQRAWYARLHSAGHLLDDAMKLCGVQLAAEMLPTKGYHFPDGPYVEYEGKVPAEERGALAQALTECARKLIAQGSQVRVVDATYAQIPELCGASFCKGPLMSLLPKDRTTRVVIVKDLGCPCGGTHVADIAEIGIEFEVKSIKVKKNKTKIAYKLAERN